VNEAPSRPSPRWLRRGPGVILAFLVVAGLALRARLLTTLNINWDEFFFLSRVHAHGKGALSERLLTFHVHLFSWVPSTSSSEIDQVFAMRAVMLGCGVATVFAIVWLGWRLLGSVTAGLFGGVACLSFSLVLQFGNSARFDPPIVAAFLVAAALIVSERRWLLPVAGALVAVAFLISIKSAFFLPTLGTLFVARRLAGTPWRDVLRDALGFVVVIVVVAAAVGAWHVATLAAPSAPAASGSGGGGGLLAIGAKMTSAANAFPQKETLQKTLGWDRAFWAYLVIGVVVTVVGARRAGAARAHGLMVLAFAIPLVALTFYRNAFPYFYVTVIPPASLLVGAMLARVEQALRAHVVAVAVVTAALASPMVWTAWRWFDANHDDQVQRTQRLALEGVHRIFPDPVPYIDRCSMVSSYPKVGLFMSTWTLEDYRQRGRPIMADLLAREQPRFVLANVPSLDLHQPELDTDNSIYALLPDDFAALRDNFVHHWGPVWVAGKRITLDDKHATVTVDMPIGGPYLVESARPVRIDGVLRAAGDAVDLHPGSHTVAVDGGAVGVVTTVVLRTAEARPPPDVVAPTDSLFQSFHYRRRPPRQKR
jgi:hypothetical protein